MILLDTNVISEPQRQIPNAHVVKWIDEQALETLYLSAITVAELRAGIALMPAGKRRDGLHENMEKRLPLSGCQSFSAEPETSGYLPFRLRI